MTITRRNFLASMVASVGAAALPARAAPILPRVRLSGPLFTADMAHEADAAWFRDCVLNSQWQFEPLGYDGRTLIRHPMTRLAYVVSPGNEEEAVIQQIAAICCPCREDLDPDYIVGHAARHVAARAMRSEAPWLRQPGALYLRFPRNYAEWPDLVWPDTEQAPSIVVTPTTEIDEAGV